MSPLLVNTTGSGAFGSIISAYPATSAGHLRILRISWTFSSSKLMMRSFLSATENSAQHWSQTWIQQTISRRSSVHGGCMRWKGISDWLPWTACAYWNLLKRAHPAALAVRPAVDEAPRVLVRIREEECIRWIIQREIFGRVDDRIDDHLALRESVEACHCSRWSRRQHGECAGLV